MIERLLSTDLDTLVQRAMDAAALQHKLIANNIANVDTPGFKRSEVVFQDKLRKALEARADQTGELKAFRDDPRHFAFSDQTTDLMKVKPQVVTETNTSLRNDQNNVDIDVEMANLAQNTVLYDALAQVTRMQFADLRYAISEGK